MSGIVLVTGASGHLGANLTRRLLRDGYDVRVLLSEREGHAALDGLDVQRVQGDLNDAAMVARALDGCRYVFHTAAEAESDRDASATQTLLRAAGAKEMTRVVVTDPPDWAGGELATLAAHNDGLDALLVTSSSLAGPNDYRPSPLGGALVDFANGRAPGLPPGGLRLRAVEDVVDGHLRAMARGRSGARYVLPIEHFERDAIFDLFEEVTGRARPWRVRSGRLNRLFKRIAGTPSEQVDRSAAEMAQRELGVRTTGLRAAVHAAYADFARRGLVPSREGTVGDGTRRRVFATAAAGAKARVARRA